MGQRLYSRDNINICLSMYKCAPELYIEHAHGLTCALLRYLPIMQRMRSGNFTDETRKRILSGKEIEIFKALTLVENADSYTFIFLRNNIKKHYDLYRSL